jgi:hypothetical protein
MTYLWVNRLSTKTWNFGGKMLRKLADNQQCHSKPYVVSAHMVRTLQHLLNALIGQMANKDEQVGLCGVALIWFILCM